MWWNPFTVERFTLTTPLFVDECTQRLRANVDWTWDGYASHAPPFVGWVGQHRFTILRRRRFSNNLCPLAHGTLQMGADGKTTIRIRIAVALFNRVIFSLPLLTVGLALVLAFLGALGLFPTDHLLSAAVIVGGFGAFAAAFVYSGYLLFFWFVREDRLFLITTLERVLQTSEHLVRDD
jgi:hypothetical protein